MIEPTSQLTTVIQPTSRLASRFSLLIISTDPQYLAYSQLADPPPPQKNGRTDVIDCWRTGRFFGGWRVGAWLAVSGRKTASKGRYWSLIQIFRDEREKDLVGRGRRSSEATGVERGLTKWALIARIMAEEFQITRRTGKQCRQRYHNHLDNRIKHGTWPKQEEKLLIDLQNSMGNHWAQISRTIAGRSENCVENKFYQILRRGVKTLNLAIKKQFQKYKQLDVSTIYEIIDRSEPASNPALLTIEARESIHIKRRLLFYGVLNDSLPFSKDDYKQIKALIDRIRHFEKLQSSHKLQAYLHSEEVSQKSVKQERLDIREERVSRNVCVIEPSRASIQSLGLEPLEEEDDPVLGKEVGQGQGMEPLMSKNIIMLYNLSVEKKGSLNENEANPNQLLRRNSTIKSFEFPEHDLLRSPFLMLESPHFDQMRGSNFNNWSHSFLH